MSYIDDILQQSAATDTRLCQSFSLQLAGLLRNYGYTGDLQDRDACTHFLCGMYRNASVPFEKSTLKSWFSGESRPFYESRSRKRMHNLCFVFNFDYFQVCDFFQHVYLSRAFNCRCLLESVYCYCFSVGKDYAAAQELYVQASKLQNPLEGSDNGEITLFTGDMEREILALGSDQEFFDYVKSHKGSFGESNQSAKRELKRLLGCIQGTAHDQALVNSHRKNKTSLSDVEYGALEGLAVREYFLYHDTFQDLKGQNVASADFMLSQILGIRLDRFYEPGKGKKSFSKNAGLPRLARINFPSRQLLSDILNGDDHVTFDAVRKMLILLHFYGFFAAALLGREQGELYSAYVDDARDQLEESGYGPLYEGSPYDQIFLISAKTDQPLDTFRDIILEAAEEGA